MYPGVLVSDGGSDSVKLSGRKSRITHRLRVNLNHHPATDTVTLEPTRDRRDRKLVAEFDTSILADGVVGAKKAKLEANWWPQPVGTEDQFKFHYIEYGGYDCGWHRQPHPDESQIPFDHFQQRMSKTDDYQYQGVTFQEETPVGLLWEVTHTRLPKILKARW